MTQSNYLTMKQIITNILDQHAAYKTWEEVADMTVRELRIKEDSDFGAAALQASIAELERGVSHWKANHDNIVRKLQLFTQREDLPVDRLPAYQHVIDLERQQAVLVEACQTFVEWLRRENEGFVKAGNERATPEGEQRWREWYQENLRLCALAQDQAISALAAVKPAEYRKVYWVPNDDGGMDQFDELPPGVGKGEYEVRLVKPAGQEGGA